MGAPNEAQVKTILQRVSSLLDEWNDVEYVLLVRNDKRWSVMHRASIVSLMHSARSLLKLAITDYEDDDDDDDEDDDDEC